MAKGKASKDNDDYEVTKILEVKGSGRNRMYLVEWSPSWVKETELSCKKLIAEFNKSHDGGGDEQNGDDDNVKEEDDDENDEDGDGESPSKGGRKRGRPTPKKAGGGNRRRKSKRNK